MGRQRLSLIVHLKGAHSLSLDFEDEERLRAQLERFSSCRSTAHPDPVRLHEFDNGARTSIGFLDANYVSHEIVPLDERDDGR